MKFFETGDLPPKNIDVMQEAFEEFSEYQVRRRNFSPDYHQSISRLLIFKFLLENVETKVGKEEEKEEGKIRRTS